MQQHSHKISRKAPGSNTLIDPIFALFLVSLIGAFGNHAEAADRTDFDIQGSGRILYVTDGDTARIRVHAPDKWQSIRSQAYKAQKRYQRDLNVGSRFQSSGPHTTMLVRIGNIDTAESVHPDASQNSLAGVRASDYAKQAFQGDVDYRCWTIGYYGRPICSITTARGDWGTHMIQAGFSKYVTKYGRHPFEHKSYQKAHAAVYQ